MSTTFNNTTAWQTKLLWTAIAVLGAVAFAIVALNRGEAVNAAWLVVAAVCIYFIAYRFYGLFVAKALGVDGARPTPAYRSVLASSGRAWGRTGPLWLKGSGGFCAASCGFW